MNFAKKVSLKQTTAVLLILAMLLTMLPQTVFAETRSYTGSQGDNPWITMTTSSSVSVGDIVTDDAVEEYFSNTINTELDPQSELRFRFVPSGSGTQNPDEDSIIANTLPYISIYRQEDALTQTDPVADYDNGAGKIRLENIRTGQTQDTGTVDIEIAVESGTLQNNTKYALVFEKELSVKNSQNKIGRDIVFYFQTKEAESGLALDKTSVSTTVGQQETLSATFDKVAVDSQQVTWSSSNEDVAEVENGVVKAISEGSALITGEYNQQQVTCSVFVGNIAYGMQGIGGNQFAMLQPDDITVISINDQRYLNKINTSFHDDEDINFIFTMSAGMQRLDDSTFISRNIGCINVYDSYGGNIVAKYEPDGEQAELLYNGYEVGVGIKVSIPQGQLKRGTYYLVIDKNLVGNASDKILGKDVVFQFKITDPYESIEAESISLDWDEVTLASGAELRLRANILPEDTTNKIVTWESSEKDVASVDREGNVTAVSAGTAVITAKTANGKFASCSITVEESNIKLNTPVLEMSVNEVQTLKAYVNEEKITPQWESSEPGIVSVDENGNLRALSSGHAVITATSGNEHTVCVINVTSYGTYDWQGIGGNTMLMETYDDIYVKKIDSTAYYNGINTLIDGSQDIIFGFTMSAGINSFADGNNFITNCMPYIKIYDTYPGGTVLAQYENTDEQANLSFYEFKDRTVYLKVPGRSLRNGTYYLVFGEQVCGNNIAKKLGKPVIFKFTVQWDIFDLTLKLSDQSSSLEEAVNAELSEGKTSADIEILHIITDGDYVLTDADFQFIREELGQTMTELDLKEAALVDNKLAEGALEGCSSLEKITLPAGITALEARALYGCSALAVIVMTGEVPPVVNDPSALEGTTLSEIIVPSEYLESYNESSPWQNYEVIVKAEGITISQDSFTIEAGKIKTLTASILPENSSNKTIRWKTSDTDIAAVDQQGNVTGIKSGTAVITVTAEDGSFEASCKVTVTPKITLNADRISIYSTGDDSTYQLTAEVTGTNLYTADDIEWESYNETIAKVSASGLVTGVQSGETVIFARLDNCFKFCAVKVNEHTVSIDKETAGLLTTGTGSTETLKATVDGAAASGTQVTWSSSDTSVASVTRYTGIIAGKGAGTAVITAEAQGKKAECTVTVIALGKPTAKAASAAYNQVRVTWTGVSKADGYVVSRCTSSGTVTESWTMPSSTRSLTDMSLTSGTAYYYKVNAYKTINNVKLSAEYSELVKAKPVPAAPTAAAARYSYSGIKVTWNGVSGASGYQVYRATTKTGTYRLVNTSSSTARSYVNTGLTTGTTYYYKVRAYRTVNGSNVYGTFSAIKSAKPILSTPVISPVAKYSSGYVKVKWKGISGESGYQVYRATSKNGKYTKVASVKMTTYSYPYAKIKATKGKVYYYKVRAYKLVNGKYVYSSYSGVKYYKLR